MKNIFLAKAPLNFLKIVRLGKTGGKGGFSDQAQISRSFFGR
jgi:hypothetical protein